jgi:hypothetical protein
MSRHTGLGHLYFKKNLKIREEKEAKDYYIVKVLDGGGSGGEIVLMLTENEVMRGIDRAGKNPEDLKDLGL